MVVVGTPAEAAEVWADAVVGAVDADVTTTYEAAHRLIWATRYIVIGGICSKEKMFIRQSDSIEVWFF